MSSQKLRNEDAGRSELTDSHARARRLFDRTAENYQQRSERKRRNFSSLLFQRRIEIVDGFLGRLDAPALVLDYGMGPAVFGPACAHRGLRYLGIDISPEMVERASALNLPNTEYRVGDLDVLDSYRGAADAALAIGLLDYLEDPDAGLDRLAACVRPGGSLIVSFRNRNSVPRLLRDGAKAMLRPFRGEQRTRALLTHVHEKSFDPVTQLVPALAQLGFTRFETAYFNCSPFFFSFPLPRWLWTAWSKWDAAVASERTRWLCSGGVLAARKAGESAG